MHSFEPEYLELHAAGLLDQAATTRAIALDRGTIFSVFEELRFALYAAVAAITAGIGILLKENLDHMGPLTLIAALALVAAGCYASAVRTRLRNETRSIAGDYVLLLGALIVSADLGYAESQFHWLGPHWSWQLLILATLHAITAYALSSRLVLSVSLVSLAGWFGLETEISSLFQTGNSLSHEGIQALICSAVLLLWREIHRRLDLDSSFEDVFEHFAANIGFSGALALCFTPDTRLAGVATLLALAVVSIRKGLHHRQEMFVIYGTSYTALGLSVLEAQIIATGLLSTVLELATVVTAVVLLWTFHRRMKETA
jgi:hypothetical protein